MEIKVTIDRFEEDMAVLKTQDNQNIVWPKDKLPKDAREGSIMVFKILTNAEVEKDKREQAKEILNEILDTRD